MRYAFILNPASGQGKIAKILVPEIQKLIDCNPDKDIRIYYTAGERDAIVVADCIASETEDKVMVFACGGDGTIQEVANGLYGHDNAVMAIVPLGSGNDFARALGGGAKEGGKFKDLAKHLDADIKKIDLIRMTWKEDQEEKSIIVVNGINIGFDGNTAILAHDYKNLPLVSGTGSYILALIKNLIEKKGENLKITADGKEIHNGPLLLATAANGGFCGGGFESCPRADLSNGLLELLIVNNLSRIQFLQLVPKYKNGKILDIDNTNEKYYKYTQAKEIIIKPIAAPTMKFVADGEIYETSELKVEVLPQTLNVTVF